jgi:hypothetical protein
MSQFKDSLGRPWTLSITVGSLKRIEAHAGFDIADISNGKAVLLFTGDHRDLVPVVWPLVKKQADEKGIDEENFSEALWGEGVASAIAAVKEALLDFFPPDRRPVIRAMTEKMDAVMRLAVEKGLVEIASVQVVTDPGGSSPISAPESSDSDPTSGPSESSAPPETPG